QLSESLSDVWPNLIGEWVWSKAAFGDEANTDVDAYFHEYREMFTHISQSTGCSLKELRRLREEVAPQFIDFCADCTDWGRFGLVGFTVVYQQLLARSEERRVGKECRCAWEGWECKE